MTRCRVLLLPGWLDSDAGHWQSHWERLHGWRRVTQSDWLWPKRGDWMARLEEVLLESDGPAVLVAHSLGCHLVAAWAAQSQHTARVRGALLVAPPDIERDDMPPHLRAWRPILRQRLPFPATAVTSEDDPYGGVQASARLAREWGARQIALGACGHINGQSGLGDWAAGQAWVDELAAAPAAHPPLRQAP